MINRIEHVLLKKSLSALKQVSRCWNAKLKFVLSKCGLQESKADPCLFAGWFNSHKLIVAIYVDDGVVMSPIRSIREDVSTRLRTEFQSLLF